VSVGRRVGRLVIVGTRKTKGVLSKDVNNTGSFMELILRFWV